MIQLTKFNPHEFDVFDVCSAMVDVDMYYVTIL